MKPRGDNGATVPEKSGPADSSASGPVVSKSVPKQGKHIARNVFIIIGIVLVLLVGLAAAVLNSVSKTVSSVSSGCNAREARIQAAADNLQAKVNKLTISGIGPKNVSQTADKDCLDGSGKVSATADFNLAALDVSTANMVTIRNLDLAPSEAAQTFSLDNGGDDTYNSTAVNFVSTKLIANDGNNYRIEYWLTTPVPCATLQEKKCSNDTDVTANGLLDKPVDKVSIILSGSAG